MKVFNFQYDALSDLFGSAGTLTMTDPGSSDPLGLNTAPVIDVSNSSGSVISDGLATVDLNVAQTAGNFGSTLSSLFSPGVSSSGVTVGQSSSFLSGLGTVLGSVVGTTGTSNNPITNTVNKVKSWLNNGIPVQTSVDSNSIIMIVIAAIIVLFVGNKIFSRK